MCSGVLRFVFLIQWVNKNTPLASVLRQHLTFCKDLPIQLPEYHCTSSLAVDENRCGSACFNELGTDSFSDSNITGEQRHFIMVSLVTRSPLPLMMSFCMLTCQLILSLTKIRSAYFKIWVACFSNSWALGRILCKFWIETTVYEDFLPVCGLSCHSLSSLIYSMNFLTIPQHLAFSFLNCFCCYVLKIHYEGRIIQILSISSVVYIQIYDL